MRSFALANNVTELGTRYKAFVYKKCLANR